MNRRSLFATLLATLAARLFPKKVTLEIHRLPSVPSHFDNPAFRSAIKAAAERWANEIDRQAADYAFSQIRLGEATGIHWRADINIVRPDGTKKKVRLT